MAYDLIIKNGMVVDGTGFSRYRADVAVIDGRIAEIGRVRGSARKTIDAEGLFVAPGIIDLHTHYDVQPFWDRLCTSSVWHGVTTVLTGNCGLTLAPLRPEHRETMLATFCCVEDLPVRSLGAVLPWTWQSFDEFLKAIDIGLGVNMMPLVGHNPLRLSVMDGEAVGPRGHPRRDRGHAGAAARGPRGRRAGAGARPTRRPTPGRRGSPCPRGWPTDEERIAFGRTLGEFNRGVIEILPPGAGRPDEADQRHLLDVAQASGRPVFFLGFDASARSYVEGGGAAGRAALQSAPRHSLQPALHAQEDDLLRQSRRVGCRHGRALRRAHGAAGESRASARSCGRRPRSDSAAGPACSGGSSSGTRSSSARSRSTRTARWQGRTDRRSGREARASTSPT